LAPRTHWAVDAGRLHSDEFKADTVAAAAQPGVSMAAVAMRRASR
jgi:transposase-like protein